MKQTRRELSRSQILAFRRQVGSLDERLPMAVKSLRPAAWAGLQDSMPRAALLSLHARVARADPTLWEHPSFVQLWGPRYSNYVVAAKDLPIVSLGRRVWPGALLVSGEIGGVWRRASAEVTIETWRRLSSSEREAVEVEALSLPLPGLDGPIVIRWLT
jgi:hypothetical protein